MYTFSWIIPVTGLCIVDVLWWWVFQVQKLNISIRVGQIFASEWPRWHILHYEFHFSFKTGELVLYFFSKLNATSSGHLWHFTCSAWIDAGCLAPATEKTARPSIQCALLF